MFNVRSLIIKWNVKGAIKVNSILLILFLTVVSCSKEKNVGCTDRLAINYNLNAEIDSGFCECEKPSYTEQTIITDEDILLMDCVI